MINAPKRLGMAALMIGAVIFLVIGTIWSRGAAIGQGDYKVVYYSARCLIQHEDPYNEKDVRMVYDAEGRERSDEPALDREVKTRFFYPPTAFIVTVPIALFGFSTGKIIWMLLCAGTFLLANFLVYDAAADFAPIVAGSLCGLLLASSFWLLMIGNSAAIAVSLCIIATWCFYRERFAWTGVVCLALSLSLKPNDSGLIWLFFLLAAPTLRKRALQSLAALILLSLPFLLWVTHAAPRWLSELRTNMASFSGPGGIVDPGLSGMAGKNMDCIVQLQTVVSVFFDNSRSWNLITWSICAPLLVLWAYQTLKTRPSGPAIWLGLAAAAPLTVLPTYHFQHDAKLLLIAIPACAMLWRKAGLVGNLALLVTLAAIFINGDILSAIRILLTRSIVMPDSGFGSHLATLVFTRPGPLVLLAMAVFYLGIFLRSARPVWLVSEPEPSSG